MLIPATVMPSVFDPLRAAPAETLILAVPPSALVVVLVIAGIALKMAGAWRLRAPDIGAFAGSGVAAISGRYNAGRVADAP